MQKLREITYSVVHVKAGNECEPNAGYNRKLPDSVLRYFLYTQRMEECMCVMIYKAAQIDLN